jgi:hypothetical protein
MKDLWPLAIFPIYLFVYSSTSNQAGIDHLKSIILSLIGIAVISIGSKSYSRININRSFFVIMMCCVMTILTSYMIYGINISEHAAFSHVPIKHYQASARLYLPASLFYSQDYTIGSTGLSLPRAIGIFREPGVFQIFLNTAIILSALEPLKTIRIATVIICIIGVLLTGSTAGLSILCISIPLHFSLRSHSLKNLIPISIAVVVAFCFIFPLAISSKSVGLMEKLQNESGEDRVLALREFWKYAVESGLWGTEWDSASSGSIKSETGSLPLFYIKYGLIGFIISTAPFYWLFSRDKMSAKKLLTSVAILTPLFITALTSQPIWQTTPWVFLVVIASVNINE